jgi:hypothetical protein
VTHHRCGDAGKPRVCGAEESSQSVLILVISAICPRWLTVVILCGLLAAALMAAESWLWLVLRALGEHGSGNDVLVGITWFSIASLVIYFPTAI